MHPAVLVVVLPVGMGQKHCQVRHGLYAGIRRLLMVGSVHLQLRHQSPGS